MKLRVASSFWFIMCCGFVLRLLMVVLVQGGLNKFHGQHALRERARKLDQGILIIRFLSSETLLCFLV